jgi:hypothetical protein
VSRHGCTPAYPSLAELDFFLERGIVRPDLRHDQPLEQIHWSTNRQSRPGGDWPEMRVWTAPSVMRARRKGENRLRRPSRSPPFRTRRRQRSSADVLRIWRRGSRP